MLMCMLSSSGQSRRIRRAIRSGEQWSHGCSSTQATSSGWLMQRKWRGMLVFSGCCDQQSGYDSRIWSCCGAFPGSYPWTQILRDTDAFFQSKMAVGHGGLLLAAWLLLLPSPPESRPGPLPLHAPTMWCVWNENLPPPKMEH